MDAASAGTPARSVRGLCLLLLAWMGTGCGPGPEDEPGPLGTPRVDLAPNGFDAEYARYTRGNRQRVARGTTVPVRWTYVNRTADTVRLRACSDTAPAVLVQRGPAAAYHDAPGEPVFRDVGGAFCTADSAATIVAVGPGASLTGTVQLRQPEVGVYRIALVEQRRLARRSALATRSPEREPIDPLRELMWTRNFTITTTYR